MQQSSDQSVTSRLKAFADSKPGVPNKISATDYQLLGKQLAGLIEGETDPIANLANFSALLWQELDFRASRPAPGSSWVAVSVAPQLLWVKR